MTKEQDEFTQVVKIHFQNIDKDAEIIMLAPQSHSFDKDTQLFVLTAEKVDFKLEKQMKDAGYKVELLTGQSILLYIYTKEEWHKQFKNTPIYKRVCIEGILL